MKKLFVNSKQQATITCEHCDGTHTVKVPLHIRGNTPVKVECQCGRVLKAIFEFRQTHRKNTFLQALLQRHATDVVGQAAQIRNISQSGLKLTTRWWRNIHKNDVLSLTFVLDNPQRSKINKRVIVKYIDAQEIGAEFCPEDELSYQKEIGFYLMRERVPRETGAERVASPSYTAEPYMPGPYTAGAPVVYGYV